MKNIFLAVLVVLAVTLPPATVAHEFVTTGIWHPVYGVAAPPNWLYDMATNRGTI